LTISIPTHKVGNTGSPPSGVDRFLPAVLCNEVNATRSAAMASFRTERDERREGERGGGVSGDEVVEPNGRGKEGRDRLSLDSGVDMVAGADALVLARGEGRKGGDCEVLAGWTGMTS
jgi:hypothetical protein